MKPLHRPRSALTRCSRPALAGGAALLLACLACGPARAGTISVNGSTCTLPQAINLANNVNVGGSTDAGACVGAAVGANTIGLPASANYTFTHADNFWYGPNALPAIQSNITVEGHGTTLTAAHTGDPAPTAANAFRNRRLFSSEISRCTVA